MTARFVLASSIWLLEGPPLNNLIAIVKERGSAAEIAGSVRAISSVLTSIDLNEPHCGPIAPDLRLERIRGGLVRFDAMNTAHPGSIA